MKLGIIGNGFVGKATYLLKCDDIDIVSYDINPELCNPLGTTLNDLMNCDFIFISVPTPMNKDGSCHTKIVESVVNELNELNYENFIVIRSTVPVGTCDKLNCYFMPEFLTEKNFERDFINNENWIFGLLDNKRDFIFVKYMDSLINLAHDNNKITYANIHYVSNKEAEMVKLFRNCYLATKVSFCNEVAQFCNIKDMDYNKVITYATLDDRITTSHTNVPGPDGKRGYGGTCFPKDINNLKYEMEKSNMKSYILKSVIERNEEVDRVEKDWNKNVGRSVI